MAILRNPGGSGTPARRQPRPPFRVNTPTAPQVLQRAIQRNSARSVPQGLISQPRRQAPRPSPAPKPPPVVVANNQGNFTRPKPPPPVRPGNITGGGGGNRGNNNRRPNPPRRSVPVPTPTNPTAQVAPTPAPQVPVPPELDAYLAGDVDYQSQLGQFGSELTNFQAQQQATRDQNAQSFAQRLRDLQQAQTLDESDLQEDFASRGLANSGVYGDALSQLQQQYLQSQGNLQTEQTSAGSSLDAALAEFQAQQQAAQQQAYLDAIARRAAQYGL